MFLWKRYFIKNHIWLTVLLAATFIIVTACSPTTPGGTSPTSEDLGNLREFTLEELAEYNGEDGKDAYVAVDGIVYDVTYAGPWRGGIHNGFTAGRDLTEEIKNDSPHGVSKLNNVPMIGKVEE